MPDPITAQNSFMTVELAELNARRFRAESAFTAWNNLNNDDPDYAKSNLLIRGSDIVNAFLLQYNLPGTAPAGQVLCYPRDVSTPESIYVAVILQAFYLLEKPRDLEMIDQQKSFFAPAMVEYLTHMPLLRGQTSPAQLI